MAGRSSIIIDGTDIIECSAKATRSPLFGVCFQDGALLSMNLYDNTAFPC